MKQLIVISIIVLSVMGIGHTDELPSSRLYAFSLPGISMACQFTPAKIDQSIETGTAMFWQLGTPNYWQFDYTDNGFLIHLDNFPGYFYHLGCNGVQYVPPGGFTMLEQ